MGRKKTKKKGKNNITSKKKNSSGSNVTAMGGPIIHLVRHAKSAAQAAGQRGLDRNSEDFRDCYLANSGVTHAKSLSEWLNSLAPTTIYVSPLTRTLETYNYMALNATFTANVIAEPRITELSKPHVHENIGRNLSDLQSDWKLQQEPFYTIDFSPIQNEDVWWNCAYSSGEKQQRLQAFLQELVTLTDSNVVVVCHFNTIRKLTNKIVPKAQNCGVYECTIVQGEDGSLYLKPV